MYETDEYLVVCAEVISGDIAGRTIDYITTSDTAQCMCKYIIAGIYISLIASIIAPISNFTSLTFNILLSFSPSAPSDFTAQNNTCKLSSNAPRQCIPIAITSDSVVEPGQECFTFAISTVASIAGLTLSPSETEICIADIEGKRHNLEQFITNYLCIYMFTMK